METCSPFRILPTLATLKNTEINLDELAQIWHARAGIALDSPVNPLLDPEICQNMIEAAHRERGIQWSYGGYLEDRRVLWRRSYLDRTQGYIHLGVDFNAPAGTPVAAPGRSEVLLIDDDRDLSGGWGPRVVMRTRSARTRGTDEDEVALIFAHLGLIGCSVGDMIEAGKIFAEVGAPPRNGNWFPHLHVQTIRLSYLNELLATDIALLDGYGKQSEMTILMERHPDPIKFCR